MRIAYAPVLAGLLGVSAVLAPAPAAAQDATATAVEAVKAHFRQHAARYAAGSGDLADLGVTDAYTDARTGTSYVYLRQRVNGIEVYNAPALAAVTREGQLYGASASFVAGAAARAADPQPVLSAADAVRAAARHLGVEGTGTLALLSERPGVPGGAVLSGDGLSAEPIPVRLVYFATEAGPVRLAWDLTIDHHMRPRQVDDGVIVPGETNLWSVRVDAASGAVLDVVSLTDHDHWGEPAGRLGRGTFDFAPVAPAASAAVPAPALSGSYRVVPMPFESPSHGAFSLVASPHNPAASPNGWHTGLASHTVTRGNNVYAYPDRDANNVPDATGIPDGGAGLVFDFPFDPNAAPLVNLSAAVTSLFYWNNIIHDVAWHYGFTEAAGNFQEVNTTGQGAGNDYVQAEALDGSGTNNANFSTPSDGQRPRMQMFEWTAGAGLTVTAPAPAAGDYPNQPAGFGPPPPNPAVNAGVVLVDDGFGSDLGCVRSANPGEIAGNYALIQRGSCEFGVKVRNAILDGAIGAIVYNCLPGPDCSATTGEELVSMGNGATPPELLTVPATFIRNSDGVRMVNNLAGLSITYGALGPNRDSDLDAGVILHEYGHGISNRLVGGPATTGCLSNAEQMGEGWSDFFGILLTMQPGDVAAQNRGVGTYLGYEPNSGVGIRPAPYTTDFAVNPYTYQSVITLGGTGLSIPHGIGFAWATMLWEMTWELIATNGWDADLYNTTGMAGNQVALRLVIEGLKVTPCSPGFVQGRDAILAADQALYGGAHALQIWTAFARRGLGFGASQGSSSSVNDGTASFIIPPGVANEPGAGEAASAVVVAPRPNPATSATTLAVELRRAEAVRVEVFDALGRRVALAHDGDLAAGVRHEVALETAGLAPGVYVWRVVGESFAESGRLTVVR